MKRVRPGYEKEIRLDSNIWKIAHVTPLHKKGPENLCNNYRPISLLSREPVWPSAKALGW